MTDTDLGAMIKASPVWRERDELLQSVPGVGPVLSRTLARRSARASAVENSNFLLELRAEMIALHLEIVARLQIEPEAVTGPEIPGEAKRCIRRKRRACHERSH